MKRTAGTETCNTGDFFCINNELRNGEQCGKTRRVIQKSKEEKRNSQAKKAGGKEETAS
jgi:hypothetical protein